MTARTCGRIRQAPVKISARHLVEQRLCSRHERRANQALAIAALLRPRPLRLPPTSWATPIWRPPTPPSPHHLAKRLRIGGQRQLGIEPRDLYAPRAPRACWRSLPRPPIVGDAGGHDLGWPRPGPAPQEARRRPGPLRRRVRARDLRRQDKLDEERGRRLRLREPAGHGHAGKQRDHQVLATEWRPPRRVRLRGAGDHHLRAARRVVDVVDGRLPRRPLDRRQGGQLRRDGRPRANRGRRRHPRPQRRLRCLYRAE